MDRRSWPWTKKSSNKSKKAAAFVAEANLASTGSQGNNKSDMDRQSWTWKKKSSDKSEKAAASAADNNLASTSSQGDNKSKMDRQSWPWKKKSYDKFEKTAASATNNNLASTNLQGDNKEKQLDEIRMELEAKITNLEQELLRSAAENAATMRSLQDQSDKLLKVNEEKSKAVVEIGTYKEKVQKLEDRIKELNENLSAAHSEMTTQNNRIKEAVLGCEKAEAEALALKNNLESVTLSKLTVEDRASHLDGDLKECMGQIQNFKEEHELKLQEVLTTKEKQLDEIRMELETKITNLEQELLRSAAENAATMRSLQDQSDKLLKVNEEKSKAVVEIGTYKEKVQKLEDRIKELNENLSAAHSEMTTKDNRIKEAVSGCEKAEAEALALKNDLESVTLSKLTVEDRASHLDGALKECMGQIQNLKEERELKLQEVVTTKEKQLDEIRMELEAKITNLEQELLRSAAENAATNLLLHLCEFQVQILEDRIEELNEEKSASMAEIARLRRIVHTPRESEDTGDQCVVV